MSLRDLVPAIDVLSTRVTLELELTPTTELPVDGTPRRLSLR